MSSYANNADFIRTKIHRCKKWTVEGSQAARGQRVSSCFVVFFVNVILIYLKHINRCRPPREAIWRGDGVFRNNFQTKWNYQNVGSCCCCCWMNLSRGSRAFLFIFLKIPTRIHDDTHTHTNKSPNPWRKISRLLLWNISKWWWTAGVGFGGGSTPKVSASPFPTDLLAKSVKEMMRPPRSVINSHENHRLAGRLPSPPPPPLHPQTITGHPGSLPCCCCLWKLQAVA